MPKIIENHHFRDEGDGRKFMSGLPLPRDPDGIVRNIRFVDCSFHFCCVTDCYENCDFVGCYGSFPFKAPKVEAIA